MLPQDPQKVGLFIAGVCVMAMVLGPIVAWLQSGHVVYLVWLGIPVVTVAIGAAAIYVPVQPRHDVLRTTFNILAWTCGITVSLLIWQLGLSNETAPVWAELGSAAGAFGGLAAYRTKPGSPTDGGPERIFG